MGFLSQENGRNNGRKGTAVTSKQNKLAPRRPGESGGACKRERAVVGRFRCPPREEEAEGHGERFLRHAELWRRRRSKVSKFHSRSNARLSSLT